MEMCSTEYANKGWSEISCYYETKAEAKKGVRARKKMGWKTYNKIPYQVRCDINGHPETRWAVDYWKDNGGNS